jgi:hypothetical protein
MAKPKAKKRVKLRDLKVRKGGAAHVTGGAPKKQGTARKDGGPSMPAPTPTPSPTPTTTPTPTPS